MFDEIDIAAGDRLPIFPLPLVLMPGEILPLHIFEPRYRQMLSDIGGVGGRFGVVTVFENDDAGSGDLMGRIGTAAAVHGVDELEDGRSNVIVLGTERFRITNLVEYEEPYLISGIEPVVDDEDSSDDLKTAAEDCFALFRRMTTAAFKMSGSRGELPETDQTGPEPLSFLIATAFDLKLERKYELISTTSTRTRLDILRQILSDAIEQIEHAADLTAAAKTNGHSKKKLDL
jgi:Lon protease-like protein